MSGRLPPRLLGALTLVLLAASPLQAQQQAAGDVLVVSRERVLQEAAPAERLNDAEAAMTAELQARVDALKAELAAEEQELTRLRGTLPADQFDRRVREFDQRVRREREITQRRAAALQTAFREARKTLVEALVPILVTLSREKGAKLVLDSDQILVAHPSVDITDEAIAMMARVAMPPLPSLEALPPIDGEAPPGEEAPTGGGIPPGDAEQAEEAAPAEGAPAGEGGEAAEPAPRP